LRGWGRREAVRRDRLVVRAVREVRAAAQVARRRQPQRRRRRQLVVAALAAVVMVVVVTMIVRMAMVTGMVVVGRTILTR
jgi:hypothetical protein